MVKTIVVSCIFAILILSCGGSEDPENDSQSNVDEDTLTEEQNDEDAAGSCGDGYEFDEDGNCIDINECESDENACNYENSKCTNTEGSFECGCASDYVLKGEADCKYRFDFEGPEYEGDVLLVINESLDKYNKEFTGTFAEKDALPVLSNTSLFYPQMLQKEGLTRIEPKANEEDTAAEGDTEELGTIDGKVPATLLKIGKYCKVWVEDEISSQYTQDDIDDLAKEFDETIYPLVTENFFGPSDVNMDGKVAIFIYDIRDPGIGGYFYPYDLSGDEGSNMREILYIDYANIVSNYSTIAHELQHLVHYNANVFVEEGDSPKNKSYSWIDEGLAMAAEHLYVGVRNSRITYFNSNKEIREGHSLLYWDQYVDPLPNYSLSYLFFQYLSIQTGRDESLFKDIIEDLNNNDTTVDNIIKKYLDSDKDLNDVMREFRLALLVNEDEGVYGFGGDEDFDSIKAKFYTGTGIDIRGGGALYVEIDGEFTEPQDKGENIKYVGVYLDK